MITLHSMPSPGKSCTARQPRGKLPVLAPVPGEQRPESNAIPCDPAETTPWLPGDRLAGADWPVGDWPVGDGPQGGVAMARMAALPDQVSLDAAPE